MAATVSLKTRNLLVYLKANSVTVASSLQAKNLKTQSIGIFVINVASNATANTFSRHFYSFRLTWQMVLHVVLDVLLLSLVINKTPFSREIKKMKRKIDIGNELC